jgi:hypothetical protein
MSFRNKKFSNTIYSALKENKSVSLKMLLEDNNDEDDKDTSDSKSKSADDSKGSDDNFDFSFDSDDTEGDEPAPGAPATGSPPTGSPAAGGDADSDDAEGGGDVGDESGFDEELIANLANQLVQGKNMRNPDFSGPAMSSIVSDNKKYYSGSISSFVLNEESKETKNKLEKDFESLLDDSEELISRANVTKAELYAGDEIDVDKEVNIAIDKLIHFREKVDVIDLLEELFCNKIRLTAEIKMIDTYIEEFKEKYAEAVHKNRSKIDVPGSKHYNDESVYLDKYDGYNGAAGARSQG